MTRMKAVKYLLFIASCVTLADLVVMPLNSARTFIVSADIEPNHIEYPNIHLHLEQGNSEDFSNWIRSFLNP